jgi:hypothetical protein
VFLQVESQSLHFSPISSRPTTSNECQWFLWTFARPLYETSRIAFGEKTSLHYVGGPKPVKSRRRWDTKPRMEYVSGTRFPQPLPRNLNPLPICKLEEAE